MACKGVSVLYLASLSPIMQVPLGILSAGDAQALSRIEGSALYK
jgi:hypothetical protein